jgi:hypothetical protein
MKYRGIALISQGMNIDERNNRNTKSRPFQCRRAKENPANIDTIAVKIIAPEVTKRELKSQRINGHFANISTIFFKVNTEGIILYPSL